jgi:alkaline phosphatase D
MKIRFVENRPMDKQVSRRRFLRGGTAMGAAAMLGSVAAPRISRAAARPVITHGIQSGDAAADRAVLWSRADRPANAVFEWATTDSFKDATTLPTVTALPEADFTAKILATGLPSDQDIFYRVTFKDLSDTTVASAPLVGHFRTAPTGLRDVSFTWSGDTVGQGWGIDEDRGGMKAIRPC